MLTLQNNPVASVELPGVTVSVEPVDTGVAKFDLEFLFEEPFDGSGGLAGTIEYASDLFDTETAARFAGRPDLLLAAVVADPGLTLDRLHLPGACPAPRPPRLGAHWVAAPGRDCA